MSATALPSGSIKAPAVLADALPGERVRDVLLVLAGAGLTTLGAMVSVHIPGSPVPVTGQTLAAVLAGAALGSWRGITSQALYLVLGLFLPIYAGGTSGASVLWSVDGGYIVGFILAAGIVGWAAEHGADRKPLMAFLLYAVGQASIFAVGVPWFKIAGNVSWGTAIHEGFVVFIFGGAIKALLAAISTPTAWRVQRWVSRRA